MFESKAAKIEMLVFIAAWPRHGLVKAAKCSHKKRLAGELT